MRSDGSYVGRAAPEIDLFEALVDADGGKVSLSAQWAPYNVSISNTGCLRRWISQTIGWLQLGEYKW
jgi:hypothetical protein